MLSSGTAAARWGTVSIPCNRRIRIEICSNRTMAANVIGHALITRGHDVAVAPAPTEATVDVRVVDDGAAWLVTREGIDTEVRDIDDLVGLVEGDRAATLRACAHRSPTRHAVSHLATRTGGWSPRSLGAFLTTREREVLAGLVEGASTMTLARRLEVQPSTVRAHIQSVLSKLCVHSRVEAVVFALEHGIVSYDASRSA